MASPYSDFFDARAGYRNDPTGEHSIASEGGVGSGGAASYWQPILGQDMNVTGYHFNAPDHVKDAFAHVGEAGGGIDYSKMPGTKFGAMSDAIVPINSDTKLYSPGYAYNDPNYGRITLAKNVKEDMGLNPFEKIAMMVGSMGFGALAAPAMGAMLAGTMTTVPKMAFQMDGMQGTGAGGHMQPPPQQGMQGMQQRSPQSSYMAQWLANLIRQRGRQGG